MIDIHCHILHGIDDGPATIEDSIILCRKLYENGIKGIIATPHFISGDQFNVEPLEIREKLTILNNELEKNDIKLDIYPGMEVFAAHDTVENLRTGRILTLNDTKYVLIEFSLNVLPKYAMDLLFSIQLEGYIPIIAHPERYCEEFNKSGLLEELVERGILVQVNTGSIMGKHGRRIEKAAVRLLRSGLVHIISSDSHGGRRILKDLPLIEKKVSGLCGAVNCRRLLYDNPQKVVNGIAVENMDKNKKKFFISEFLENLRYRA